MTTRTGAYLAEQRRARRLSPQQLATLVGYANVAKGANRILALERDGVTTSGLLDRTIAALGLDRQHVETLLREDRQQFAADWHRWVNAAVEPQLRFRALPAVWCREALPKNIARADAVAFARARAAERGLIYVLVWSRREEIWCYADGRTEERTTESGETAGPSAALRGRGNRRFIFG